MMKLGAKNRKLAEFVGQLGVVWLGAAVLRLMFVVEEVAGPVCLATIFGNIGPTLVVAALGILCIGYGTIAGGE